MTARRGLPPMRPALAAGCAAAAALLAGWWAWPGDAPPAARAAAAGDFPWAATAPPGGTEAAGPPALQRTAQGEGGPLHATAAPVFDICGLGRFGAPAGVTDPPAAGLDSLPPPVGRDALAQARERWLAALRAGSPVQQAAGLLLAPPQGEDPAAWAAWAQRLLHTALASRDVPALAWAEEACGHLPDGPACRVALLRARIGLEPDNGVHWAALAEEDPDAADEAWRGLQQARRWHARPQALLLAAQSALPPDLPGYLQHALGVQAQTRALALPGPGEGLVRERCAAADPARQPGCDAVIGTWLETADGHQSLAQAVRHAEAAGWPPERLAAVRAELQAPAGPGAHGPLDAAQPLSCASVDAWRAHVAALQALGERGAVRARLAAASPAR